MSNEDKYLEILTRIINLESRLSYTVERLNGLITKVENRLAELDGDHETPSLMSRVLNLEKSEKTFRWVVGVLYTAVVTGFIKMIMEGD